MHIGPIRWRDAIAALAIALVAGLIAVSPAFERLHGLSIDALTALRWRAFGQMHDPRSSPTVSSRSTRKATARRRSPARPT